MYLIGQGDDIDILSINFYGSLRAVIVLFIFIYPVPSTFQAIKYDSYPCAHEYMNARIING